MIKKLLRFIITIAVIAGIVFGIVWLTSSDSSPDFVYNMMRNQEYEVQSVNSSFDFTKVKLDINGVINLQLSNATAITSAINDREDEDNYSDIIGLVNGNYQKTILLLEQAQRIILNYHIISASGIKTSISLQNEVVKQIDTVLERVEKTHKEFARFSAYQANTSATKASLNSLFNAYYDNYHLEVQAITRLAVVLRDYCLSDVYSGVNNKFDFIMLSALTEVTDAATGQTTRTTASGNLFDEFKILKSNFNYFTANNIKQIDLPAVQFVNMYLRCENSSQFLVNEEKADYILENGQDGLLQNIYNFLFVNQGGI